MEVHRMLSCLRISIGNHNLVLHEGWSHPPLTSLISVWIIRLCTSMYAVFLQEASCFKVFQLKFFINFSLSCMQHAPPISSPFIWSPYLIVCEESKLRNFSMCPFILLKLGIVFKGLSSKINPRKWIACNPNFQEYPSVTEY
jgi:hypothetical protein